MSNTNHDAPLELSPEIVFRSEYFGALLFDKRSLAVIEVNAPTTKLLSLVDGTLNSSCLADVLSTQENFSRQKVLACVSQLLDVGILRIGSGAPQSSIVLDPSPVGNPGGLSAPLGVSIETTDLCNLNCRYCFQGAPRNGEVLSREEILCLLEDLAGMKVFTVFFGGGEPLMCPHFREVAEYARDLGLEVGISSNGTLITDEVAEWFAKSQLDRGLQISLDGSEARTHDALRGHGSFARTMDGIRLLSSFGVRPSIGVTVTSVNIHDVCNLVNLSIAEGVRHVHVMCLLPSGNALVGYEQIQPTLPDWRNLQQELSRISEEVEGKVTIDWGNWCYEPPHPEFVESDYTSVDKAFAGCPAGKTKAVIGCYGDVYGCDVLKRDDMVAGNVRTHRFSEIWRTSPVIAKWRQRTASSILGKCSDCKWLFACVGGCPAMAVYQGHSFFDADPVCPHTPGEGVYLLV